MKMLTEGQAYTVLKDISRYNHYIQACVTLMNTEIQSGNKADFTRFDELLYAAMECLAQKYIYLRDNNLLGCEHIDFLRRVAGTREECEQYPIVDSLDNYNDIIAKMYPDFDGKTCITITFQLTESCNLNCTYCYQHNKTLRVLSFEDAKMFIDQILTEDARVTPYLKSSEYKSCVIDFIGGEPFLEVELMDKITQYFIERLIELNHPWLATYMVSISSNGILYETECVQDFIKKYDRILSLSITVDGTKELHDKCRVFPDGSPTYDIAHNASLDYKQRYGVEASKITLAPENIMYFAECILQMLRDGFHTIHANFVFEQGWQKEHARIYYDQVKMLTAKLIEEGIYGFDCDLITRECASVDENNIENWCGGTGSMLCLSPNGMVYPCVRYAPSSIGYEEKAFAIGSVENGIGTNEDWLERIKALRQITRQSQSSVECLTCTVAEGCGWCSAYNYECYGTANKRATFICCMHKARALASVFYNNLQYKFGNGEKAYDLRLLPRECIELIGKRNYSELVQLTKEVGGTVYGI